MSFKPPVIDSAEYIELSPACNGRIRVRFFGSELELTLDAALDLQYQLAQVLCFVEACEEMTSVPSEARSELVH